MLRSHFSKEQNLRWFPSVCSSLSTLNRLLSPRTRLSPLTPVRQSSPPTHISRHPKSTMPNSRETETPARHWPPQSPPPEASPPPHAQTEIPQTPSTPLPPHSLHPKTRPPSAIFEAAATRSPLSRHT